MQIAFLYGARSIHLGKGFDIWSFLHSKTHFVSFMNANSSETANVRFAKADSKDANVVLITLK